MRKIKKPGRLTVKHPFLKGLSSDHKEKLLKLGSKAALSKGDVLFNRLEKADQFYLLLKGKVDLIGSEQDVRFDRELERKVFQTLSAGDVVGLSWVLSPYRWSFDAVVRQDCQLLVIDGVRLRKLMAQKPIFGYEIYKRMVPIMNERLVAARVRLQMFGATPFSQAEGG